MRTYWDQMHSAFPSLTRFSRWWFAELAGLVPRSLLRALRPSRPSLLLDVSENWIAVSLAEDNQSKLLGHIDFGNTSVGERRQVLHAALLGLSLDKTTVILRLPSSQTLRWRLELPSAAEAELPQALTHQIRLRTLFQPDETYFDYHIAERSADGAYLTVDVAVVPRQYVDPILTRIEALGLKVERLDVAAEGADSTPRFNLLPQRTVSGLRPLARRLNAYLAVFVAGLLLVSVALPFEQRRARRENVEAQLAAARSAAQDTLRLKTDVERLSRESRFLIAQKEQRPVQILVLDALTAILPDRTSLTQLKVNGRQVSIVGTSAAASSLVGLIDDSPMFRSPRFRSPITQDARSGLERFNLALEIEER